VGDRLTGASSGSSVTRRTATAIQHGCGQRPTSRRAPLQGLDLFGVARRTEATQLGGDRLGRERRALGENPDSLRQTLGGGPTDRSAFGTSVKGYETIADPPPVVWGKSQRRTAPRNSARPTRRPAKR